MMCIKRKFISVAGLLIFVVGIGCSSARKDVQEHCPIPLPESIRVLMCVIEAGPNWSCEYELEFSREDYLAFREAWTTFTKEHEALSRLSSDPDTYTYEWKERVYIRMEFDDANNRLRGRCYRM
jgi:hypothetical protein